MPKLACYPTEDARAAAAHSYQESQRPAGEVEAQVALMQKSQAEMEERERKHLAELKQQDNERAARREQYEQEKRESAQKEQARLARQAEVARMAKDKDYAVPAISAIVCIINEDLADLRQQMTREQRVAAISGVTSLKDRREISSAMVDATDELKVWQTSLRRYGATALPCKSVAGVIACHRETPDCDQSSRDAADVWAQEYPTLWGSNLPLPDTRH